MVSPQLTRREALATSLNVLAAGLVGGCSWSRRKQQVESRMELSLSVRVAEPFGRKDTSSMTLEQLIGLAKGNGYRALCMRASQAGTHTVADTLKSMHAGIRAAALRVSMVTGDYAVPRNDEHGPDGLRNITPYLDLAEAFETDLIRICMKKDEDIPWAQRASDEARERGIRLVHQAHCASLFETVDGSLRVLQAVGRENFGIIYEPANWMATDQDYGRETIKRLSPYLFNVYVQNHRNDPDGTVRLTTWARGKVGIQPIGLWDEGGVDFDEVFAGLDEIGYRGYFTAHQAAFEKMSVEEAVRRSAEFLRPRLA